MTYCERHVSPSKKLQDILLDHNNIIDPVLKLFYDLNIGFLKSNIKIGQ